MATPTVQTESCRHCGADIREGSVFCYGCGKELVPADSTNGKEAWAIHLSDLPEIPQPGEPLATTAAEVPSNRNRKRRARKPEPQIVEVTWVPSGTPTLFYLVSIVVAGLAILLILLALYVR